MKFKELHFADVAEIQEAVTDELKKVPKKRGIFGIFSEKVRPRKSLYIHIDIFANCNWVNTGWQWFVHIYTQKLHRII
jgi:hypothetical protein